MITIVLEDNGGKGRTVGHYLMDDGASVDDDSYVTQIEAGELDNAFGDAEECPRCGAHLDTDDCSECGMTAEDIYEDARPRCHNFDECGSRIYMGDWDDRVNGEYYCSGCVTVVDSVTTPA